MKSIISEFELMGGKHCITNSLKQVFRYYGKSISEEMLYGIGSGLGFVYTDDKNYRYLRNIMSNVFGTCNYRGTFTLKNIKDIDDIRCIFNQEAE